MAVVDPVHSDCTERVPVIVVTVPFPAQGHLNPLLCLSTLLSSFHIPVHYVGSATHIRQAKLRANWSESEASSDQPNHRPAIQFHHFPVPEFSIPPPDPRTPTKFPAHLQGSFDASLHLREPVALLLKTLSPRARRIAVIHDPLLGSVVQDATSLPNVETFGFQTPPAFFRQSFAPGFESPIPLPSLEECCTPEFRDFIIRQAQFKAFSAGHIHNTCRAIERHYVDLEAEQLLREGKKFWAIGPLIRRLQDRGDDICLKWLDQQLPKSVLFISFGTTTAIGEEQIRELAIGLEESETKFIWVLRDADKGDIFADEPAPSTRTRLPEGFEERTKVRGMVVSHWVPQLEILGHPSTGGFMSHCGWNSCLDSITMGVPIAAWPMHSDQPANAVLVTEILKMGIAVQDWSQKDIIVRSSAIKETVRRLMASEEGDEIRRRAELMGNEVRNSIAEGGETYRELESFVEYIKR